VETGRNVADIADAELLCELGVYCDWAKVYLVLDAFQIYSMAASSYPTKFPDLTIINYLIAQQQIKLVKPCLRRKTNRYLLSLSRIYSQLLLRIIPKEVLLIIFLLIIKIE